MTQTKTLELRVEVPKRRILLKNGYKTEEEFAAKRKYSLDEYIRKIRRFIKPQAVYALFDIKVVFDHIFLENTAHNIKSEYLAEKFKTGADHAEHKTAALFVATIGSELQAYLKRGGHCHAENFIYNYIASEMTEETAQTLNKQLNKEYKVPKVTRFSPGFGDWTLIDAQKMIFGLLQPAQIGVTLDERSGFMTPEKSVSGIIRLY
jgi:cobalamin-dependent methionine synthase I